MTEPINLGFLSLPAEVQAEAERHVAVPSREERAAALRVLEACGAEVEERYGVSWTWPGGDVTTGWYGSRGVAVGERDLPHRAVSAALVRRWIVTLPPETVEERPCGDETSFTGERCIFGLMFPDSRGLERCVLPPRHDGLHRTADGRKWTDPADNPGDLDKIECPF